MRSILGIILIILLPLMFVGQVQAQDEGAIPISIGTRFGVGWADNLDMIGSFDLFVIKDLGPKTWTYVGIGGAQAKWDANAPEGQKVSIQQGFSLDALVRREIWNMWGIEGGPGLDRIDKIGDEDVPVTYVTGTFGIYKEWRIKQISLSAVLGTNYNFGNKATTLAIMGQVAILN